MAVRKKCAKRICNDDRLSRVPRDYIEPTYALAVYLYDGVVRTHDCLQNQNNKLEQLEFKLEEIIGI